MNFLQRFNKTFGVAEPLTSVFHAFPIALRFQLGGEVFGTDDPIPRFLQAIDRARAVTHALFETSIEVHAYVLTFGEKDLGQEDRERIVSIKQFAFRGSRLQRVALVARGDEEHIAEFGEDLYRHWFGGRLSNPATDIDRVLWCPLASEMPISPSTWGRFYLVDWTRRLLVCPYDDRGMDVAAMDVEALRPLYERFNPWLLDHGRAEMDQTFAA